MRGEQSAMKTIFAIVAAAAIGLAASGVTRAQTRPDLYVRGVTATQVDRNGGAFVGRVIVVAANFCRGSVAGPSYVQVTFKSRSANDGKSLFFIGKAVKPLRGGESQTLIFDVRSQNIRYGRHVLVEVDPYKKVNEASEDNNWRTLFPDGAGTQLSQSQCLAKQQ